MKIRNRIMSWILSPGAYAVWHALGNPGEWHEEADRLTHLQTHITLQADQNAPAIARWLFLRMFLMDGYESRGTNRFMLFYERPFVYGRAQRCIRKLRKAARVSQRRKTNMDIFLKLTVNE